MCVRFVTEAVGYISGPKGVSSCSTDPSTFTSPPKPVTDSTTVTSGIKPDPEYRAALEHLASTRSAFIFPNSNPEHASLVIEALVTNAQNSVRIFEEKLNGDLLDINPRILDAIREKTSKGVNVRIVIQDGTTATVDSVNKLRELEANSAGRLEIRKASPEFIRNATRPDGGITYFTIGDESSFRIESSEAPRKAMCSFERPRIASTYLNQFDKGYANCAKYFG